MHIDKSNYEIWIIDWLDGNLNSLQSGQLMAFLDQNPDLREELYDLRSVKLISSVSSFPNKEKLKKDLSDISQSQFEYLCVAYLENDLTFSQKEELLEIIGASPARKRTFDQIQKATLSHLKINYKHKSRLLRQTTSTKIIRRYLIGFSTAAAIALIVTLYSVISSDNSSGTKNTVHNMVADKLVQRLPSAIATDRIIQDSIKIPAGKKIEKKIAGNNESMHASFNPDRTVVLSNEPLVRSNDNQETAIKKVTVTTTLDLKNEGVRNTIIPSGTIIVIPDIGDDRSKTGRFLSKTFRQKFLKDKAPADSPIKGYEVAEAGVAGLNKLLGWQMALDLQDDGNGQVKSVRFSSGILKIQTPVKKKEPHP
jgi:hypothetical protein